MKQVIEVNDLSELREEEGKLYVCRRYDGGCDGNLWYKGDTTIDHYIELEEQLYEQSSSMTMEEYFRAISKVYKQVAAECDPQEIYIYEYNNHECQYTHDADVYRKIQHIFGEDAKQIKRF